MCIELYIPDDCYPLGSHFSTLFRQSEKKNSKKNARWGGGGGRWDENEENVLLL
jgi:hypothetical protein